MDDLGDAPPAWTRRSTIALCLVVALHVLVGSAWTLLQYPLAGNDEQAHADMVFTVARERTYPAPQTGRVSKQLRSTASVLGAPGDRGRRFTVDNAPEPAERVPLVDLAPDGPSGKRNQMSQHPPLFYVAAAVPTLLLRSYATMPWDTAIALMRLVNVLALAGVAGTTLVIARRLTGRLDVAVGAGLLPLLVPRLVMTGATVNNDVLVAALTGGVGIALAALLTGDRRWWPYVTVGLAGGAALATKAFALIVPVWVGLVVLVVLVRHRDEWRTILLRSGGAALVALVVCGWWWIRNVIVYGALVPPARAGASRQSADLADLSSLDDFVRGFSDRFFPSVFWAGRYGPEPSWVSWAPWAALALVVVALAVRRGWSVRRRIAALLVFPAVLLTTNVLYVTWSGWLTRGQGSFQGTQGRYLYAALPALLVVVAVGVWRVVRPTLFLPVVGLLAVVVELQAAVVVLGKFWGPPGGSLGGELDAVLAWSPWPGWLTTTTLAVSVLGLVAVPVALAVIVRREPGVVRALAPLDTAAVGGDS